MRRAGFTLLEIMLAVAIMAMIGLTVYDFTDTTLAAARFSVQRSDHDGICTGLKKLVETQLSVLPGSVPDALIGFKLRRKNTESDTLQLVCPAGNAVLAPDAKGYYQVTLTLREVPRGSGKLVLGLDRSARGASGNDDDDDDDDAPKVAGTTPTRATNLGDGLRAADLPSDWIPLAEGVTALEIAYFDHRLNDWVERWSDQSILPDLVRLRLSFTDSSAPYEMVIRVPGGGVKRAQPVFAATFNAAAGQNPAGAPILAPPAKR